MAGYKRDEADCLSRVYIAMCLRAGWSVFVMDETLQVIHAVVLEFCDSKTIVLKFSDDILHWILWEGRVKVILDYSSSYME